MEITFLDINPYENELKRKIEEAETFEQFEEICAVVEYVDRVQMAALVSDSLPDDPEELSEQEILDQQKAEELMNSDPKEILRKMYEELKREEGDV